MKTHKLNKTEKGLIIDVARVADILLDCVPIEILLDCVPIEQKEKYEEIPERTGFWSCA